TTKSPYDTSCACPKRSGKNLWNRWVPGRFMNVDEDHPNRLLQRFLPTQRYRGCGDTTPASSHREQLRFLRSAAGSFPRAAEAHGRFLDLLETPHLSI